MRKEFIIKIVFTLSIVLYYSNLTITAQIHPDFTITKNIKTTPVKNQYSTGTCWCFATLSFLETEALRLGKPELNLSEMYIVRYTYNSKAIKYFRNQGKANFGEGGQAHDVLNVIKEHGVVTEDAYPGLQYGYKTHNHRELSSVLESILKTVTANPENTPTTAWLPAFNAVIETYLGKAPTEVNYLGKSYDPVKFSKEIAGINPDDYIELTSYKTYPYYKQASIEIPDNWSHNMYYNVPIQDLMSIMDYAVNNGYSVAWDGDVSEKEFKHYEGKATLSNAETERIKESGIENLRQTTFDNYTTTDDHLMHITGLAKDKNGADYYLVKNSWGENSNQFGGYLYMSNSFAQLKTIAILVHKDAIPKEIKKKLNLL
jgi:bleomycin hydrolase